MYEEKGNVMQNNFSNLKYGFNSLFEICIKNINIIFTFPIIGSDKLVLFVLFT